MSQLAIYKTWIFFARKFFIFDVKQKKRWFITQRVIDNLVKKYFIENHPSANLFKYHKRQNCDKNNNFILHTFSVLGKIESVQDASVIILNSTISIMAFPICNRFFIWRYTRHFFCLNFRTLFILFSIVVSYA